MFDALIDSPEDALHAVMARYNADPRPEKIDLGVGVYREANGTSPIMQCVSRAQKIWQDAEQSKGYLALKGNEQFLEQMSKLVFANSRRENLAAIQTVGGTGGVRLAVELAAKAGRAPGADLTVFVGVPTWPNHLGICDQLGVRCETWPYFDVKRQSVRVSEAFAALDRARAGDLFVLHGPCHNPTGADLSDEVLGDIIDAAASKGVVPLIDCAYYGLGSELRKDMRLIRSLLERTPEALLVLSCSKAFGLYRERAGVLFACCNSSLDAGRAQGLLERMARGNYSMPPSHGAAVASVILANDALNRDWQVELSAMRKRIAGLRRELSETGRALDCLRAINQQKGIFSLLDLTRAQVDWLAKEHAIYLPASGRINIVGLKTGDVSRFTTALTALMARTA